MYDKLEQLRELVNNIEMEECDRKELNMFIDDLERDFDIQDDAYAYLSDEEEYE